VADNVDLDGDIEVCAVLNDAAPDIVERLEPSCGRGRRVEEAVGDTREDCGRRVVVGELRGCDNGELKDALGFRLH
jgi:hypothetical protein